MRPTLIRHTNFRRRTPAPKTSYELFDSTVQKTQIWLKDLMSQLDWQDRPHKAYLALRTVLHALRDRSRRKLFS